MSTAKVKYFSNTVELILVRPIPNAEFAEKFPGVVGKKYDGYQKYIGFAAGATMDNQALPVTRKIDYKKNPSLHKCDARCRHAKGGNCECSCGGQFHGAGN